MLILAGVSISAIVGEDGLLTKAQQAPFANKLASYNEEFEMNAVGAITDEGIDNRDKITLMNEYVKQYVPSLEDNDIGQFAIINGQLYYVGDEDLEREVCKSQGYNTLPEGMTAEEFASSVESSAIEEILKNMTGDAFTSTDDEGNTQTLGIQLWDKTFGNGNKWKIITEVENGVNKATYGTEWYYVEAGQNVEGIGILKNSYIINYTTRKAVRFDANKHTMLAYGSNLAVTDGLVFNADPTNMGDGDAESWGEAIFNGFSGTEYYENGIIKSGWSSSAFVFDGEDDHVILNSPGDFSNGFTFEFYGNNDRFTSYNEDKGAGPLFIRRGTSSFMNSMRFGYLNDDSNEYAFWKFSNKAQEKVPIEDLGLEINKDYFFTYVCSIDNVNKIVNSKVYIDGIKKYEYNTDYNSFISGLNYWNNDSSPFIIGRSEYWDQNRYYFFKGKMYSTRLYTSSLTTREVKANYNATVSYHNILVNNGNASTGGNTGGEDIGTIE